jgi:hypothetical protein
MGGCTSSNASAPQHKRPGKERRIDDDELTIIDLDRINEEARKRIEEEEEMSKLIYAEKAALRLITSRLIEKRASCESLMDLLDADELVEISVDDASFRAQKRVRRQVIKRTPDKEQEWMVRNGPAALL